MAKQNIFVLLRTIKGPAFAGLLTVLFYFVISICGTDVKANELNKYFYLDTLLFLPKEFVDYDKILVKTHKDKIFLLYNEVVFKNDSNLIMLYDVLEQKFLSLLLPNNVISYFNVRDFDLNENNLFLLFYNGILHYQKKFENFEFNEIIKIHSVANNFGYIRLENDSLHLFEGPINLAQFDKLTTTLVSINTKDYSESVKEFIEPKNNYFLLFQPRKCFDYINQKFLVSEITQYKFYIYSFLKNRIDTIIRFPKDWVPLSSEDSNKIIVFKKSLNNNYVKNFIDFLRTFVLKISTIHKVYFLNDSTILVYWSKPPRNPKANFYDFQIDIFKLIQEQWIPIAQSLPNKCDEDEPISEIVIINNNFYVSGNKIYCIEPIPFNIKELPFSKMSYKKFKKKVEEYYSNNDIQLSLLIFKLRQ